MTTANIFWHAICVHIRCTSFFNTFEALETEGGGEDAPGSAVQWPWPQVTPLHTSSPSQLPRLTCIGEPAYLTPTYYPPILVHCCTLSLCYLGAEADD